jgi:hypothetical protein
MKNFKTFVREQKQAEGETTLDPDFLEKKERHDNKIEAKLEKPTKEISKEAEQMADEEEEY